MTKDEFLAGWALLLAQPWGARYARVESETDRLLSKTQADLYYREFAGAEGGEWIKACTQFAKGTRWPSIDELRISVRARPNPQPANPAAPCTLKEFGETLYAAIMAASRITQIDRQIAGAVWRQDGAVLAALQADRRAAIEHAKQLAASPEIADTEAAELARRYPWLLVN
jgi:hypothetical protein